MKIAFFEIEPWEAEYMKESLPGHELFFYEDRLDADHLPERFDFDVVSIFTNCKLDSQTMALFPQLKFVATRSTGYDHIDIIEAEKKSVPISNVPSYGENTVAEFAFALLLALSRKIFKSYDRIKESGSWSLDGLQGFDLKGKTIGVVGTGRIGRHSIRMAKGFDMNVVAFDAFPDDKLAVEAGIKYLPFEELLKVSDIITIHVPDLPTTRHMINMENISLIKRGAVIINTARGSVVETAALVKGLSEGIIGGAGLDVLEEEVPTKDEKGFLLGGRTDEHDLKIMLQNHLLIDMDNVIITPHNAFNTKEALERILQTTVENINAFVIGGPKNAVRSHK